MAVDSPFSDFVLDMITDRDFPAFAEHSIIKKYLEGLGANDCAIEAFEGLWEEYSKENNTQ